MGEIIDKGQLLVHFQPVVTIKQPETTIGYEVLVRGIVPGATVVPPARMFDAAREAHLLVELDDSELMAKRQAALAQLASADAKLRNAGVQYSRELWSPKSRQSPGGMGVPNLFDQMFTEPMDSFIGGRQQGAERSADLFSSGTQITQARNAIVRAQSEIQAIDAKLRDTRSVAPFDGVITRKFIEVGDTVQPGMPLIEYANATNDNHLKEFVRAGYEYARNQGIARIGLIGETCTISDMIATAIKLTEGGAGEYWDDVDGYIRNQLIEQQLANVDQLRKVSDAAEPVGDRPSVFTDNVIERTAGVFCGCADLGQCPNPYSIQCCTGNGSQGLYYAWEGIIRKGS